jgi:hypothetical protein
MLLDKFINGGGGVRWVLLALGVLVLNAAILGGATYLVVRVVRVAWGE